MLKVVGFHEIRPWQPGAEELMTFNDFSIYKKEIVDLKVEAINELKL
jgi:hypothetical protein